MLRRAGEQGRGIPLDLKYTKEGWIGRAQNIDRGRYGIEMRRMKEFVLSRDVRIGDDEVSIEIRG